MNHPPGTVGILSTDLARYAWFSQSLIAQQLPEGMAFAPVWITGQWVSAAVNLAIRAMPPESQWFQLWADDHRFDPDTLLRLLAHEKDVVAPLCALRTPPFQPSLFTADGQEVTWEQIKGVHGLLPVEATGGPGMVIRRHVLEAVGDPWFESMPGTRVLPKEDLYFCAKVRKAGCDIYVDLDTPIEHITSMSVRPHQDEHGSWHLTWWSYGHRGSLQTTIVE